MDAAHSQARAVRILHFVTGGFSGATQVAVDLALAAQRDGMNVLLVLRRKRNTSAAHVQALREKGLNVHVVSNWWHAWTVWELRKLIRAWKPDAVFAHGFSDHIWGRQAAIAEGVPHVFHVEHNSRERYTARRLRQALALATQTQASIGVSEGVAQSLIARGFPPSRCIAIPNGIDLTRFPETEQPAQWSQRDPKIMMVARFAKQKDHQTLLQALALLKARGLTPALDLAGGGNTRLRRKAEKLAHQLGLQGQLRFLGNVNDLPQRLAKVQIFVLATHWEGMPLALVEAMAAGCACIASDVSGVREVFRDGLEGVLVPHADAVVLADALARLLMHPDEAQQLGHAARIRAFSCYGQEHMWLQYKALCLL